MTKDLRKEITKVLDNVAKTGSYTVGHIMIIEELARKEKEEMQEIIKQNLGIKDCYCD